MAPLSEQAEDDLRNKSMEEKWKIVCNEVGHVIKQKDLFFAGADALTGFLLNNRLI